MGGRSVRPGIVLAGLAVAMLARTPTTGTEPLPVPMQPPILLRLDAVIHPTADAARGKGFTAVSIAFPGHGIEARRWLAVEDARTVGPDQPLDGKDVLNAVAPLQPNLLVQGSDSLRAPLLSAPPGTKVRMEGIVNRGSRTYLLRRATVGPDAWEDAR